MVVPSRTARNTYNITWTSYYTRRAEGVPASEPLANIIDECHMPNLLLLGAGHDRTAPAPAHADDYEMLPTSVQPGEYGDDSADVFLLLAFPFALDSAPL